MKTSIDREYLSLHGGTITGDLMVTGRITGNLSGTSDKAISDSSGNEIISTYATKTELKNEISNLISSAPETLDTLNELADALGNDPNFSVTITNEIGKKANDNEVVHITNAETIDGVKTFTDSVVISNSHDKISALGFRNNRVILGTTPVENSNSTIYFLDSDRTVANSANSIGMVRGIYNSDGTTSVNLIAHEPIKNSSKGSVLGVTYSSTGSYAVAPSTRDNPLNTEIITYDYIKSKIPDNKTITYDSSYKLVAKDIAIKGNQDDLASNRGQIGDPYIIKNAINFNTLTKSGIYLIYNEVMTLCTNAPSSSGGVVVVYGINNNIIQEYKPYNTSLYSKVRQSFNIEDETWSSWNELVFVSGDQTISGVKTFSSPIEGDITGNANTATNADNAFSADEAVKLTTARSINGTSFDGTSDIITANWGSERKICIVDSSGTNTGSEISVNGSTNISLKLPATIKADLTGNADTATNATKLATARTIRTNLASTSTASFNGTANITPGVTGVLPVANGGTGSSTEKYLKLTGGSISGDLTVEGNLNCNLSGNSDTATKLATARTIRTNLASTSTASFDGTSNITPGVIGVLPVANGGTGSSTEKYLKLTGGTCSGRIIISETNSPDLTLKNSNFVLGEDPASNRYWNLIFSDSNDKTIGDILCYHNKDSNNGDTCVQFRILSIDGTSVTELPESEYTLGIRYDKSVDKFYGISPTPDSSSNTNHIATTKWVNEKLSDYMTTGENAATATKLQTARTINGTSFNGTANITTANWGTARNISISDSDGTNTGTTISVNGSGNINLKLPATIKANLIGNADTATNANTATQLANTRTIITDLESSVSASFNGTANISPGVTGVLPVANGGTGSSTEKYLKLTGGNLTGNLGVPSLFCNRASSSVTFGVGTTWDNGASLSLYGSSASSGVVNGFQLRSGQNGPSISGYPNGQLTWNGKNVVRSVNGINADSSGNVSVSSNPSVFIANQSTQIYLPSGGTWKVLYMNWGTDWGIPYTTTLAGGAAVPMAYSRTVVFAVRTS